MPSYRPKETHRARPRPARRRNRPGSHTAFWEDWDFGHPEQQCIATARAAALNYRLPCNMNVSLRSALQSINARQNPVALCARSNSATNSRYFGGGTPKAVARMLGNYAQSATRSGGSIGLPESGTLPRKWPSDSTISLQGYDRLACRDTQIPEFPDGSIGCSIAVYTEHARRKH